MLKFDNRLTGYIHVGLHNEGYAQKRCQNNYDLVLYMWCMVFVELFCCSISSHKYSGACTINKSLESYIHVVSMVNQCRSIRTSVIWSRRGVFVYVAWF